MKIFMIGLFMIGLFILIFVINGCISNKEVINSNEKINGECIITTEDSQGTFGGSCTSDEECIDYIINYIFGDENFPSPPGVPPLRERIKCEQIREYTHLKKDNISITCNNVDDCLNSLDWLFPDSYVIEKIRELIICEEKLCKTTDTIIKGYNPSQIERENGCFINKNLLAEISCENAYIDKTNEIVYMKIKNLADENVIINYIKFDKCGDETNYKESNIEIKPDNFYEFPVNCPNVKLGDFEDDLFLEYEMGNLVVDTSGYLKNHFK